MMISPSKEDNVLFVEFMGMEANDNGYVYRYVSTDEEVFWPNRPRTMEYQIWGRQLVLHISKCQYHCSWEWLGPVVLKLDLPVEEKICIFVKEIETAYSYVLKILSYGKRTREGDGLLLPVREEH